MLNSTKIVILEPTEIDLIYKSSSDAEIGGVNFVKEYETRLDAFRSKFSRTFPIHSVVFNLELFLLYKRF